VHTAAPSLATLSVAQRESALGRFVVLRPHLQDGVPLARAAREAGVPVRTAQRWLVGFRAGGLAALGRRPRADAGRRRTQAELVALVEGLALTRPRPSVATITRRVAALAAQRGWTAPAYSTVHAIVAALGPQLMTLAQDGPGVLRDRYELVYRRQAERPNEVWQADHTELDLLVLNENGRAARPWLTVVLDDCSRAVCGYTVFLGAPSALNLSLALRQAVRPKADPGWVVHGLPEVLYADHGSDFISDHLRQVCADLHIHLVHRAVARPQGRGKVERFLGTVATELLPLLPGQIIGGKPATPPRLTLPELDTAIGAWLGTYHQRPHSETGIAPITAWLADEWLPRATDSPEQLDLLLVMVAVPRVVHRDGIRFQGLRFIDPTLAAYVGEHVSIRYDPRDIAEVRVYHRNVFICRAVSPEHASQTVTLKDIQAARVAHRRALRARLEQRRAAVAEYLPSHGHTPAGTAPPNPEPTDPEPPSRKPPTQDRGDHTPTADHDAPTEPAARRLYTYLEDLP